MMRSRALRALLKWLPLLCAAWLVAGCAGEREAAPARS
ncbi:hypothetical protein ABIC90_003647 [Variovorax boronicumulans]